MMISSDTRNIDFTRKMPSRRPRLLWANCNCLLDNSSGASLAVLEILIALLNQGYHIKILGASNFDAPSGMIGLNSLFKTISQSKSGSVSFEYKGILNDLIITENKQITSMTSTEEGRWLRLLTKNLDYFKPDAFFFYGGKAVNIAANQIVAQRGIPVIAYVGNGNYFGTEWCANVDIALTDSKATADLYKKRLGISLQVIGSFIDPAKVLSSKIEPTFFTFVNPSPQKGAMVVAALVNYLYSTRPDIAFQVVESRATWRSAISAWERAAGKTFPKDANVRVIGTTKHMAEVYAVTRAVLAPSLGYESGGRIVAEAALNGIPSIVSDVGGLPEYMGEGGVVINVPQHMRSKPYLALPDDKFINQLSENIIKLHDNELYYISLSTAAKRNASESHNLALNAEKLHNILLPVVQRRCGDLDHRKIALSRIKLISHEMIARTER